MTPEIRMTVSEHSSAVREDDIVRFVGAVNKARYAACTTWSLVPWARARLARILRQEYLRAHHGQPPKSRRTKRGGKRVL